MFTGGSICTKDSLGLEVRSRSPKIKERKPATRWSGLPINTAQIPGVLLVTQGPGYAKELGVSGLSSTVVRYIGLPRGGWVQGAASGGVRSATRWTEARTASATTALHSRPQLVSSR